MDLLLPVLANALFLLYNSFFTCIFVPLNRRGVLMATDAAAVVVCLLSANPLTVRFGTVGASVSLMIALAVRFILLVVAAVWCTHRAKSACQNNQ
jgi:O-antigen/teichoic acid export membrane protein